MKREKSYSKPNSDQFGNLNDNENDQTRPTTAM
jgi:hypothetical protein